MALISNSCGRLFSDLLSKTFEISVDDEGAHLLIAKIFEFEWGCVVGRENIDLVTPVDTRTENAMTG